MMVKESCASLFDDFEDHLNRLERKGRHRQVSLAGGHDFASNDYLGLANSIELKAAIAEALSRGVPIGSGGSRLLRGNHEEHEMLELEAARFFRSESALFFGSGYAANSALLSTLPQRGDLILYDELIHASSHEGIRLARAPAWAARHNDCQSFADKLRAYRANGGTGRPWIVVESLYSMDGDKAPLRELLSLAEKYDAFLVIDEAHATGVFGDQGRGLAEKLSSRENVITVRTCGKALGCEGALICAPPIVRTFLINLGRGFIFSTAPSPLMASAVRGAIRVLESDDGRQQRLRRLYTFAAERLTRLGAKSHFTQILPVIIGDAAETMRLAAKLQLAGFDVRGIRPPTVPDGTSRLRISITLNVDETTIASLASAMKKSMV
jgi:8-amino-7-oxononanoate synthase